LAQPLGVDFTHLEKRTHKWCLKFQGFQDAFLCVSWQKTQCFSFCCTTHLRLSRNMMKCNWHSDGKIQRLNPTNKRGRIWKLSWVSVT